MPADLLRHGLKLSHLRLIAALAETGQVGAAAERLGISQPAASRLGAEAEEIAGAALYVRSGRGIELTQAGVALAFRARRVLQELGDAGRDLTDLGSGRMGRASVGAVTGPAIQHVLPAIRQLRITHPRIAVRVEVGTSDVLGPMLLRGEIDFALCRHPAGHDPALFAARSGATEPIALAVRQDHPLLVRPGPAAGDLLAQDWVLPVEGAILRRTVERRLADLGHPPPARILATSSFLFTLAMLRQTNAIAPIARPVAEAFAGDSIATLPDPFGLEVAPYALLTRAGQVLTPSAEVLYRAVADSVARAAGPGAAAVTTP